jgi:hypothetical protein
LSEAGKMITQSRQLLREQYQEYRESLLLAVKQFSFGRISVFEFQEQFLKFYLYIIPTESFSEEELIVYSMIDRIMIANTNSSEMVLRNYISVCLVKVLDEHNAI